jgi:hypothetical protein
MFISCEGTVHAAGRAILRSLRNWTGKLRTLGITIRKTVDTGRSMTNTRIRSGNRDVLIRVFALSHWQPYNVYEFLSEYTLCAPISSSMRS